MPFLARRSRPAEPVSLARSFFFLLILIAEANGLSSRKPHLRLPREQLADGIRYDAPADLSQGGVYPAYASHDHARQPYSRPAFQRDDAGFREHISRLGVFINYYDDVLASAN